MGSHYLHSLQVWFGIGSIGTLGSLLETWALGPLRDLLHQNLHCSKVPREICGMSSQIDALKHHCLVFSAIMELFSICANSHMWLLNF